MWLHSTVLIMTCFMNYCFMYLAIWAGTVSGILEMGWDGLVLSGWMNLLFHVSKCFLLVFGS